MIKVSIQTVVVAFLCGVVLFDTGCRTRRVPDYLPREVIANQVGNAVVYDIDDPRRTGRTVTAPPSSAVVTPAPKATVTPTAPPTVTPTPTPPPTVTPTPTPGPVIDASTPRMTLYGQPTGVTAAGGGLREVTITWIVPTDEVYRYRLERAEAPDGPYVKVDEIAPRKKEYRDSGSSNVPLKDNTAYYYRMTGILDKEGPESIPSAPVKAVTAPPPSVPTGVKASAPSSRAVKLTWLTSPSVGVTLYRVERAPATAPTAFERIGTSRTPTLMDGGTVSSTLKDSTKYLYRVITVNRVNAESAPSVPAEVTTLPPPAPVRNTAAVSDEVRCIPLSWTPSPELDVVRYDIYRSRSGEGAFEKIGSVAGRLSATYLDGGVNPGNLEDEAIFFYRVRAVNAVTAESADALPVRAVTRGVPTDVGTVTAESAHPREVPVAWTATPDRVVMGYEIWRAEDGSDDWAQVGRVSGRETTKYLDRGELKPKPGLGSLKDGTVYQYKVIAFNRANVRSSASRAATAKTKVRPAAPTGVACSTNFPLSVRTVWSPNPEKDIADYVVECSDQADDSFKKLGSVMAGNADTLSARETGLKSGEVRYYRVKAWDKDGLESDWSVATRGRAKPDPDAPTAVTATPVGTNVRVSWKAPTQPDVQRYKVWRKKLFGWDLITTTDQTNYLFEFAEASKAMTIAVSAADQDQLESPKSEAIEVKPGR